MNNKILVSACLTGENCRYNGSNSLNKELLEKLKNENIIKCCPELLANQPTPRASCNIHNGDGHDVIKGNAKIIGNDGKDYTKEYLAGASKGLELAKKYNIKKVYLQQRSPTCGYGKIYTPDGKNFKEGNGIFAALLKENIPDIEIIPV